MALNILLLQQQALSYLGPKICTKISHTTNYVKTMASFTDTLKREILYKLYALE